MKEKKVGRGRGRKKKGRGKKVEMLENVWRKN